MPRQAREVRRSRDGLLDELLAGADPIPQHAPGYSNVQASSERADRWVLR